MSAKRLVIVTGHEFGIRAYEGLLASSAYLDGAIEVALAIGLDESRKNATVGYRSLESLAQENFINYTKTSDGSLLTLRDQVRAVDPHYILVIGWSSLVATEVLDIPGSTEVQSFPGGCIGMHPTLLPVGRGQAPIPWTIIKGLERSGLSVFYLEVGPDTGPIIAQYFIPIHKKQTSTSLFYTLAALHSRAGEDLAAKIATGEMKGRVQEEPNATRWPKRRPIDGRVTDGLALAELERLVRALRPPYPPAYVDFQGTRYAIASTRRVESDVDLPADAGLIKAGGRMFWRCADGIAELMTYRVAEEKARGG